MSWQDSGEKFKNNHKNEKIRMIEYTVLEFQ